MLPDARGELLLSALLAERAGTSSTSGVLLDQETTAAARELARVRRLYAAGESAVAVQLAMSNTLTALQTEAQLLELEPLSEEHRRAVGRMVDLARRLASVMRRLEQPARPGLG